LTAIELWQEHAVAQLLAMRSTPFSFAIRKASRASRNERSPARMSFHAPRRRTSRAPIILRRVAAAILVVGWLTAAAVLVQASGPHNADAVEYQIVDNNIYPITLAESKHDRQFVQRMGGDMGVWIAELDASLRSLLRPPGLAWTLLMLSTVIGVGCLGLAKLSGEAVDEWDGGDTQV
jgi:hypothetical protein